MGSVSLLPQEFAGSQEEPRTHFPPHDIGPLIDQEWKVAVRLNPPAEGVANNGLAGGPDDEGLLKFTRWNKVAIWPDFKAVMRDDSAFLCESVYMFGFLFKEPFWD
jgi:hypothetical protein